MIWPSFFIGFISGSYLMLIITDILYRWWRREAESLIETQREYIAVLENVQ